MPHSQGLSNNSYPEPNRCPAHLNLLDLITLTILGERSIRITIYRNSYSCTKDFTFTSILENDKECDNVKTFIKKTCSKTSQNYVELYRIAYNNDCRKSSLSRADSTCNFSTRHCGPPLTSAFTVIQDLYVKDTATTIRGMSLICY